MLLTTNNEAGLRDGRKKDPQQDPQQEQQQSKAKYLPGPALALCLSRIA
jgi:hypothetical protein